MLPSVVLFSIIFPHVRLFFVLFSFVESLSCFNEHKVSFFTSSPPPHLLDRREYHENDFSMNHVAREGSKEKRRICVMNFVFFGDENNGTTALTRPTSARRKKPNGKKLQIKNFSNSWAKLEIINTSNFAFRSNRDVVRDGVFFGLEWFALMGSGGRKFLGKYSIFPANANGKNCFFAREKTHNRLFGRRPHRGICFIGKSF